MKKASILFLFILLFFLGDRLLSLILKELLKYSQLPIATLYSDRESPDIIILGNSRAMRHFDIKLIKEKTDKNISLIAFQAASLKFLKVLLEDYKKKKGVPKKIIIELSSLSSGDEQIQTKKFLYFFSDDFKKLLKEKYKFDYVTGSIFNLFFFNSIDFFNILHKVLFRYEQKFLNTTITENDIKKFKEKIYKPYFFIKNENLESLLSIIKNNKGQSEIFLIVSPFHKSFLQKNIELKDTIFYLNQIVEVRSNLINLSESINGDEFFSDVTHLNHNGAKEFTKKIIPIIFQKNK